MRLAVILTSLIACAVKSVRAGCKDPHHLSGHLAFYCVDEVTQIEFEYVDMKHRFANMETDADLAELVYETYHDFFYDTPAQRPIFGSDETEEIEWTKRDETV
ncbi:hypothetical protein I204_05575 [Kwoniella mangroviensis CBS 8886]|uniref:uncharacterized protein n=1 Tax=Kwoniella mangroviensis CBS 8507 TaxID=1296122 RepID=UPI00080D244E|nr:uncharacterized protein I203_07729 [Kwoniella mangroviensis CBS 8507]OCF63304.1 hypothetical protein I203_07729 [Kwoniella mangroviensis CBS 8507]OCF73731.1 hypothetical protein I204_05575 [Kwoniella mangroviensis CBS 8886]